MGSGYGVHLAAPARRLGAAGGAARRPISGGAVLSPDRPPRRPGLAPEGGLPARVGAAGDLVAEGLAQSLARPGGNVTGMTLLYDKLELKRLATLIEAVPGTAAALGLAIPRAVLLRADRLIE